MDPSSGDKEKLGYNGSVWFDDFELREVGYAGVEVELSGETTEGSALQIYSKPYTTLGHCISVGGDWRIDEATLLCTDENIISAFINPSLANDGLGKYWHCADAKFGGKNGTAEIISRVEINGITREGRCEITTSGFAMKLLYASATIVPESIEAGGEGAVIPVGYMSDGTPADMKGASVTYKSLTPDIIEVLADGTIKAKSAGKGRVRADILLGNHGVSAETEVIITDSTPIVSATLSDCPTVGYLRDEQLVLNGIMESGYVADISAADVEWVVESDPIGGISIGEDNRVFGEIFGANATVYAKVTLNGNMVQTNPIEIEVVKTDLRDFSIDFRTASESAPVNVKIEVDNWELDLSKSQASVAKSKFDTMGLNGNTTSANSDMAIRVKVPYTGVYQIVLHVGLGGYSASKGAVYLDGSYMGTLCWEGTNQTAVREDLRSVYLEAGEHEFIFRALERGAYGAQQILKELRFRAFDSLPAIEAINAAENLLLSVGEKYSINASVTTADGFTYAGEKAADGSTDTLASIEYSSENSAVAKVSADGEIEAVSEGETEITVTSRTNNSEMTHTVKVNVSAAVDDNVLASAEIAGDSFVMSTSAEGTQLSAIGKNAAGKAVDLSSAIITWESSDSAVAVISEDGYVTPHGIGTADIILTIVYDGVEITVTRPISVRQGKVSRTYYTDEMVDAARENINKYSWAAADNKSVIKDAERYLSLMETIYNMIPGEGIPRANSIAYRNDPDQWRCNYCGENVYTDYGHYPWVVNAISDPWKIQCPSCKRFFPSNDFAKLYELGRDEHGIYNRELAHERNTKLVEETNGAVNYLKNTDYPEVGSADRHPSTVKFSGNETTDGWGVDDGFGYDTGRKNVNGVAEVDMYIAYFNHYGIWLNDVAGDSGIVQKSLNTLAKAYLYTGDIKYGRIGAVIVDRIADLYPDFNVAQYFPNTANSDGNTKSGKIIGSIWETYLQQDFAAAYDAFFPAYDDPNVISFLSEKAVEFNNTEKNDKTTPEKIRKNIEDGLLREIYSSIQKSQSYGNLGMHQNALAIAAVVLDTHPDTDNMIDWIFRYGETDRVSKNTGGVINQRLVSKVSRDGQGTESAFGYNRIWVTELTGVANTLARYSEYDGMSLYEHPKYVGMIQSYPYVTLVRRGVAAIGDGGGAAAYPALPDDDSVMLDSFKALRYTNPEQARKIAQHMYFVKGGNLSKLHYDIFTKNPESLADEVDAIIKEHGEWNYDKSSMLTGYGMGILRAGTLHESVGSEVLRDTQRDFWIYFGGAESHSNNDALNLGIESYGIGMTTDLGYPESTSGNSNRFQWQSATLAHNTVVVNEQSQLKNGYAHKPLHFDAKDTRVKVIDVDASSAYVATDEYRRSVVMIDYDSEVSYGIDFFKVRGGNDHLYSLHVNSDIHPNASENLVFEKQTGGSYAGANVPFGEDPWSNEGDNYAPLQYPIGYTWLFDIHRADNPRTGEFWVDYEICDFRKLSRNGKMDTRLRMTAVNDWAADEVTLANGMPPRKPENLKYMNHLEYMLIRRKGRDLNTLFTTVIEPYNGERYIKNIENVPVTIVSGTPGKYDIAKAVKVELIDGRTDYVVYAQNDSVTYNVGDIFEFRGFVGVYTVNAEGENIYS
ncbi:MAG: Ig-like domain-containing protein, partial [Oscillospiraceae bacterium]|nr:Ig-like domain-containing protein [Oscillospiraceae bacterium]